MKNGMLNGRLCREFMLDYADRKRYHTFTQVRRDTIEPQLEAMLRDKMRLLVKMQPSKGKTIR